MTGRRQLDAAMKCNDPKIISEIVDALLDGPEKFLVWADVISKDEARAALSDCLPRILQAIPSLVPHLNVDKFNDARARMLLTIAVLALDYNFLTVSSTESCLSILLNDFSREVADALDRSKKAEVHSSAVRLSLAYGLAVAKLSTRLKYTKNYVDACRHKELEEAEKLKNL